jgi:hypothetical protein
VRAPSRRGFLLLASGAVATVAVACGKSLEERRVATDLVPSGAGLATSDQVDAFVYLSSILTGYSPLDSTQALRYMESLRAQSGFLTGMRTLYQFAGMGSPQPPQSIEDLNDRGVFSNAASRSMAQKIITYWYSGLDAKTNQYGLVTDGPCTRAAAEGCAGNQSVEQSVVTYIDALVWKTLYTSAASVCGGTFGFWAQKPATTA